MFAGLTSGLSMPKSAVLQTPQVPMAQPISQKTTVWSLMHTVSVLIVVLIAVLAVRWWRKPKQYEGRTLPGAEPTVKNTVPIMPLRPEYTPFQAVERLERPKLESRLVDDIVAVEGVIPTWVAEEAYDGPEQRVDTTDAAVMDLVKSREAFTKDMEASMQKAMKANQ